MRGYSESDRGAFILTVSNGSSGGGGGGGVGGAPCAGGATLASQNSGVVSFTDSYDDQVTCSWAISCPQRSDHVHVSFASLDVEQDYDFVNVFDGAASMGVSLAQLSGSLDANAGSVYDSSGNSMTIQLTSDESISGDGFELQYSCIGTSAGPSADIALQANGQPTAASESGAGQWFTVQAQQGRSYDIVIALDSLDDSVLELYDTDRSTQLAQNDDVEDSLASAIMDWQCPATGTYYLKVRGYDASSTGTFSITVSPASGGGGGGGGGSSDPCAAPVSVSGAGEIDFNDSYQDSSVCRWMISCPAGQEVSLTIDSLDVEEGYDYVDLLALPRGCSDGAQCGSSVAHLTGSVLPNPATFTSSGQSMAEVSFTSDESLASRGFHLSYGCSTTSSAGGGGECHPVSATGRPQEGSIDTGGSTVEYCLAVTGGVTYQITVDLETLADSTLTLLTSDGAQLAENDDFGSGLSSYLEWTAPSSGTYKIVVGGYDQEVGTFLLTVASSQAGQNDPCDGGVTLTEDSGDIFFSNQYETEATCDWTIACNDGSPTLTFEQFDTESDYDFVTVLDGPTANSPQLAQESGTIDTLSAGSVTASGSSMVVQFTSDDSIGGQGFDASWTCGGGRGGATATVNGAQPLRAGVPTQGSVASAQPSYFSLSGEGGVTYEVDVTLGTLEDSILRILDRDGRTILIENDDYGDGFASHVTWTCPLTGTYFVAVLGYDEQTTGSFTVSATANTGTGGGANGDPCHGGLSLTAHSDVVSYRPRGQYEHNADCQWQITCSGARVTWTFAAFDTEGGFDYVSIFEGTGTGGQKIARLTGGLDDLDALSYSSAGPTMTVQFSSDGSIANDGFEGSYECGTPPESPFPRGREAMHGPPPTPPSGFTGGAVSHHDNAGPSSCEDGSNPISANAKLSDAQINSVAPRGPKIFKLVSPGENNEPRATFYMRSEGTYTDTAPGFGLVPVQWSLDWESGGWTAPNEGCERDCIDTFAAYGQQNGGNTCNRIFTDYTGEVGCYPQTGQRCFNDGHACGHQLISDFEMWIQTPSCTGAGPKTMSGFTSRCDGEGFLKILQIHTSAYTPSAGAISPQSLTQCNGGAASRVGALYCSSITPFQTQSGVHCDAGSSGCNSFHRQDGSYGTGMNGGQTHCIQEAGQNGLLWSDRDYSWQTAPSDILDGGWSYIVGPLEAGSGAFCPTEGGFRGSVAEEATIAICCANHCGNPQPTGATGWQQHPGQWAISGHDGTPCTFYETRIPPGEYAICCESCWGSGVFFSHPSDSALTAGGPGHTAVASATAECTGIDTNAKLSDQQINSVAPGRDKIFKIVSPGQGSEPRAQYFMKSGKDYVDTQPGMGLLPVSWNDHEWNSNDWTTGSQCSKQRIDSECLFGNTCNRIFTDYSSEVGCYPEQGQRCFNDGAPCGHQLIQDFELWVRAADVPETCVGGVAAAGCVSPGSGTASCAEIGEAGVHTISPPGVEPFEARCDHQGFMKILQISDHAYAPSTDAIAPGAITQCNPGPGSRSGALYCASLTVDITAQASSGTRCVAAVLGSEALWSDRDYAWTTGPADVLDGAWTYMRVPLEVGHGAPCPNEGGFRGTVGETATVAICCANHCNMGLNVPVSSDGATWVQHPGTFSITGHNGEPCSFYETRVVPGDYQFCCSKCWASGAFFAAPSSTHLSSDTTCSPISTNAKLSDAQINSVAPRRPKIFKLVSPGEAHEPRGSYYLRTSRDYVDTLPGLGLLPVEWSENDWTTQDWNAAIGGDGTQGSCSAQRIDTECLFGNTCERIFTDYSSQVGCYPDQGERCFNDGVTCGHQLIQDFEMWVRAETPLGTGSSSCASIGQAGVFTITPLAVEPFRARCDGDGFMKVLQIHDEAYPPTTSAFGTTKDAGIDGVVLDLSFDDNTLTDVSGAGQQVTVEVGTALFADGVMGTSGFQFDGATILTVAPSASLSLEDGITQSAWVWIDPQATQEMNIAEKGHWSGNWLSHVKVGASSNLLDGMYYFAFASSQFQPVNVDDNVRRLPQAAWVHVALTWDGTQRKVYVNGVLDAEDTPSGSLVGSEADPVEIGGRNGDPPTYTFRGRMDSVKLFNRALDADEIAKLAVGRLGSDAILQCNGGDSMVTLSSSHCETQTELAHSPGKVLDCRVNEFSCDSGDRVGTHGADEGFW